MSSLRDDVLQLIHGASDLDGAYLRASELIDEAAPDLPVIRLAILRSFTIEPLLEVLKVNGFLEGIRLEVFLGEFNQYQQELLDGKSRLYAFHPTVIFVAVRLEELCPKFFHRYATLKKEELEAAQHDVLQTITGWMEVVESSGATNVLLSNFLVPSAGSQGLYDTQTSLGQMTVVRAINAELVRLRERFTHLSLFDLERLAGMVGKETFCDPLQFYRMSNPYRLSSYQVYGESLMGHLRALLGPYKKCLVLDLDNVLWGGTIGEDGPAAIELDDTYPGNCFKDFQQAILQLHERGILLAINSKNNAEEALDVIRTHPHMILKEEHVSAVRVNWNDKADNLREIAQELNLGLDTMVFMDDSAAECERVRQACPEVTVVHLPPQRCMYRRVLEGLGCFDRLTMTTEDRRRGELYRSQSKRQHLASTSSSLEAFYASLGMRGIMFLNERSQIPRLAQMSQKTNQFNLTSRRYTEADIARWMERGLVYSLQIEDRFGDNGLIAEAIVARNEAGEWIIDTFLMSCRVIMRTIEDTFLSCIAKEAQTHGATMLVGLYLPTEKNQIVKDFYERRGFIKTRSAPGVTAIAYALDLSQGTLPQPSPWVELTEKVELHP